MVRGDKDCAAQVEMARPALPQLGKCVARGQDSVGSAKMAGARTLGASLARLIREGGPCRLVLWGGVPHVIAYGLIFLGTLAS